MREELKKPLLEVVRILGITLAVYVILRFLLPLVFPFLFALFLAKLMHSLVEKLHKWTKLWRGLLYALVVLFFLSLFGCILWFLGRQFIIQLKNLFANLPVYQEQIIIFWHSCCDRLESWTGIQAEVLDVRVMETIPVIWENMRERLWPTLMSGSFSWVKGIGVLAAVSVIVGISALLMLKEYDSIRSALEKSLPGQSLLRILRRVYHAGGGYVKAQLVIMLVVSVICMVGLFFAGNSYALLAGVGIGLCDALPFLGTGTVLIPWALVEIFRGEYMMAAIYAVIYTVASISREFLEPKLVGNRLGIPPLMVIISVYIGLCVYGLWGFVLGPLSYILIREIWREGYGK